jgi:hypothetical protein
MPGSLQPGISFYPLPEQHISLRRCFEKDLLE